MNAALMFAESVGIPVAPNRRSRLLAPWDGRWLNGLTPGGSPWRSVTLCHDAAHWLLAPPPLRVYPGFGLGTPGRYDHDASWGPDVAHDAHETLAVVLGNRIVEWVGLSRGGYSSWPGYDPSGTAWERAMALLERL